MEKGKYLAHCISTACYFTLSVWCICLDLKHVEITDLYQLLMQFKLQIVLLLKISFFLSFCLSVSEFIFHRSQRLLNVVPGGAV